MESVWGGAGGGGPAIGTEGPGGMGDWPPPPFPATPGPSSPSSMPLSPTVRGAVLCPMANPVVSLAAAFIARTCRENSKISVLDLPLVLALLWMSERACRGDRLSSTAGWAVHYPMGNLVVVSLAATFIDCTYTSDTKGCF